MAAKKNWGMRVTAIFYGVICGCLAAGLNLFLLSPPDEFSSRAVAVVIVGQIVSAVVGVMTYASMRNNPKSDDVNLSRTPGGTDFSAPN